MDAKGLMNIRESLRISPIAILICGLLQFSAVVVADDGDSGTDPHAGHMAMMATDNRYTKVEANYRLPEVSGVSSAGTSATLAELLGIDTPVIVSFIFTSCQTICPVLTATLSQAQDGLAKQPTQPRIISFSIDPEYDTPARLRDYAASFHANDNWLFVTGDVDSMLKVQKAFDAYRGNKLNHIPLTFLRRSVDEPWIRFEGFMSAGDLVREYQSLLNETEMDSS
jgi:protein SCO1/2